MYKFIHNCFFWKKKYIMLDLKAICWIEFESLQIIMNWKLRFCFIWRAQKRVFLPVTFRKKKRHWKRFTTRSFWENFLFHWVSEQEGVIKLHYGLFWHKFLRKVGYFVRNAAVNHFHFWQSPGRNCIEYYNLLSRLIFLLCPALSTRCTLFLAITHPQRVFWKWKKSTARTKTFSPYLYNPDSAWL